MSNLLERLSQSVILADGAMGTMLHGRGVSFEKCFDELNLTNPEAVAQVHSEYIDAGAQLILSNTFGANRFKLGQHGLEDQTVRINTAGVQLAKRVAAGRDVFVAGDVGPLGVRIAPFGRVQPEQARAAFAEQIAALCAAGADLIVVETVSDLYEIREAARAAREVCSLPLVTSVTFTRDDRTVLGDDPMTVARTLDGSRSRRDRRELLGRAGPAAAHPQADAACSTDGPLLGQAERRLAAAGRRAHHVPRGSGVFR